MKSRFYVTLAAVFAMFVATTGMANADEHPAGGLSEQQVGQKAGDLEVHLLKERYGLKDGFTEADMRIAAGQLAVKSLRTLYNLGADFTADDFARSAGAKAVAELFKLYPALPPHFTILELAQQTALPHTGSEQFTGPFSFADYAKTSGHSQDDFLVKTQGLPSNFNYADMVRVFGPERAAEFRFEYGFDKQADHAAIIASVGQAWAKTFAREHHLQDNFSAQDLIDGLTKEQLQRIKEKLGLDPTAKDEDYVVADGQLELKNLVDRINDYGRKQRLSLKFNEKEYTAAAGDLPTSEERKLFDLDADFTEADIFNAASATAQADERTYYKLAPGFTAEQDATARAKAHYAAGGGPY
jgi:hypothetical protein